jgi:hypothetical protein
MLGLPKGEASGELVVPVPSAGLDLVDVTGTSSLCPIHYLFLSSVLTTTSTFVVKSINLYSLSLTIQLVLNDRFKRNNKFLFP